MSSGIVLERIGAVCGPAPQPPEVSSFAAEASSFQLLTAFEKNSKQTLLQESVCLLLVARRAPAGGRAANRNQLMWRRPPVKAAARETRRKTLERRLPAALLASRLWLAEIVVSGEPTFRKAVGEPPGRPASSLCAQQAYFAKIEHGSLSVQNNASSSATIDFRHGFIVAARSSSVWRRRN